jgi:hypothetical protein
MSDSIYYHLTEKDYDELMYEIYHHIDGYESTKERIEEILNRCLVAKGL